MDATLSQNLKDFFQRFTHDSFTPRLGKTRKRWCGAMVYRSDTEQYSWPQEPSLQLCQYGRILPRYSVLLFVLWFGHSKGCFCKAGFRLKAPLQHKTKQPHGLMFPESRYFLILTEKELFVSSYKSKCVIIKSRLNLFMAGIVLNVKVSHLYLKLCY